MTPWPIAKLPSRNTVIRGSNCRSPPQNIPASRRVFCVCRLPFSAPPARRFAPPSASVCTSLSAGLLWIEWAGHYVTSNMHITQLAAPQNIPPAPDGQTHATQGVQPINASRQHHPAHFAGTCPFKRGREPVFIRASGRWQQQGDFAREGYRCHQRPRSSFHEHQNHHTPQR